MLFNTDRMFNRLAGARVCACIQPIHVAAALSLALHAALLFQLLSPRHDAGKQHRTYTEVHLATAALLLPEAAQSEQPVSPVKADNPQVAVGQGAQLPSLPTGLKGEEYRPAHPAAPVAPSPASNGTDERMTGMEVPRQLPVPLSGNRPLWSFQRAVLANAQAAYQAQVQRQAGTQLQDQALIARGQYEASLRGALATLTLQSHCRVTLSGNAGPQVLCGNDTDTRQILRVLERFGVLPAVPGNNSHMEIEIPPALQRKSIHFG